MLTRLVVVIIGKPLLAIVSLLAAISLLNIIKKHNIIARSSAETEYQATAHNTSEMLRVRSFLCDLGVDVPTPIRIDVL